MMSSVSSLMPKASSIAAIDEELVTPGFAVWSNLSVVVDEYQASRP